MTPCQSVRTSSYTAQLDSSCQSGTEPHTHNTTRFVLLNRFCIICLSSCVSCPESANSNQELEALVGRLDTSYRAVPRPGSQEAKAAKRQPTLHSQPASSQPGRPSRQGLGVSGFRGLRFLGFGLLGASGLGGVRASRAFGSWGGPRASCQPGLSTQAETTF